MCHAFRDDNSQISFALMSCNYIIPDFPSTLDRNTPGCHKPHNTRISSQFQQSSGRLSMPCRKKRQESRILTSRNRFSLLFWHTATVALHPKARFLAVPHIIPASQASTVIACIPAAVAHTGAEIPFAVCSIAQWASTEFRWAGRGAIGRAREAARSSCWGRCRRGAARFL